MDVKFSVRIPKQGVVNLNARSIIHQVEVVSGFPGNSFLEERNASL